MASKGSKFKIIIRHMKVTLLTLRHESRNTMEIFEMLNSVSPEISQIQKIVAEEFERVKFLRFLSDLIRLHYSNLVTVKDTCLKQS